MDFNGHMAVILVLGVSFFIAVVAALRWASKSGQFTELEKGARSIFNDEEPEGEQTDFFPQKAKKNK